MSREDIKKKRKYLKLEFETLLKGPKIRHKDVEALLDAVDLTLQEVESSVRNEGGNCVKYKKKYVSLLDEYLLMLGKVGPRPILEALERRFGYAYSYSEDFNIFKNSKNPSRFDTWKWVLKRDSMLKKAATMDGFLSVDDAADHVVCCYRYHSDSLHKNDFSSYDYIPLFHHSVVKNGYIKKELIAYPENLGEPNVSRRVLDYKGTISILVALAKLAEYDNPASVNEEGVRPE